MNKFINKHTFLKVTGQLFFIGLLSFGISCKDDPARLGGNGVLPEGDEITGRVYDQHTLTTQNVNQKSVRTSDATNGIIGTFNDPKFGRSKADFLVDFSIAEKVQYLGIIELDEENKQDTVNYYKFNNGDEWSVDSLVLVLQYQFNNWYGNMRANHNVKIHELEVGLGNPDDEYFSDLKLEDFAFNPIPTAEKEVYINDDIPVKYQNKNLGEDSIKLWNDPVYLWDTAQVNRDYEAKLISEGRRDTILEQSTSKTKSWRFKLDDELANRFFNLEENELTNTPSFKGAFQGLYITSDITTDTEGSLAKINLLAGSSATSKLILYTKRVFRKRDEDNEIITETKTYPYEFPINYENARINRYQHPDIESQPWLNDTKSKLLYVQGMAGSYARLDLPDELINWVDSLKNEEIGVQSKTVSNIEFFLKVANIDEIGRYPIPDRLTIYTRDQKGNIVDPPRYTREENDTKLDLEIFGGLLSNGSTAGTGEKQTYGTTERTADGSTKTTIDSIKYKFIMRPEYFNYIMRKLADIETEEGLTKEQLLERYKKEFASEFYIGPDGGTSDFDRVILHSGAKETDEKHRLKMNIKYFNYISK